MDWRTVETKKRAQIFIITGVIILGACAAYCLYPKVSWTSSWIAGESSPCLNWGVIEGTIGNGEKAFDWASPTSTRPVNSLGSFPGTLAIYGEFGSPSLLALSFNTRRQDAPFSSGILRDNIKNLYEALIKDMGRYALLKSQGEVVWEDELGYRARTHRLSAGIGGIDITWAEHNDSESIKVTCGNTMALDVMRARWMGKR